MMNMGLSEEEEAKYWDREARSYNMKAEKYKERYHKLAQYIIDLTNPMKTDVIMEIGVGTGVISLLLGPR